MLITIWEQEEHNKGAVIIPQTYQESILDYGLLHTYILHLHIAAVKQMEGVEVWQNGSYYVICIRR